MEEGSSFNMQIANSLHINNHLKIFVQQLIDKGDQGEAGSVEEEEERCGQIP